MAAACAGNACAYAVVNTTPLIIGALITGFAIDEAKAGALVTVELLVLGATALIVAPWLRGERKRRTAVAGALILLASQLAACVCDSLPWMFVWLAGIGLGVGLMLSAINAIIAATDAPERLFGLAFMTAYGLAALLVFVMSPALASHLHAGAYGVLSALTLLTLPTLLLLPRNRQRDAVIVSAASGNVRTGALLLGGIFVIGVGMMGFYTYIERLGVNLGLGPDTIASVFAAQQFASVLGSALAASLGLRFGIVRALLVGTLLHTGAVLIAVHGDSLAWFASGVVAEGFSFLFILPLQFMLAARIDATGRWAAAANGALFISTGIAPFLLGWMIGVFDYDAIAWMMLAATPPGMLAFAGVGRRIRSDAELDNIVMTKELP